MSQRWTELGRITWKSIWGLVENCRRSDWPRGRFNYLGTGYPKQWKLFLPPSVVHGRFSKMLSTMPKDKASLAVEAMRNESNKGKRMVGRACHEVVSFERRL